MALLWIKQKLLQFTLQAVKGLIMIKKTNYIFPPLGAVLSDNLKAEERTPKNIKSYSDRLSVSSACQDDEKYGSVTKDFEALRVQKSEFINQITAFRSPVPSPCQGSPKSSQPDKVAQSNPSPGCAQLNEVIELEEPEGGGSKTGKDVTSAIVLVDSDDEDGSRQAQAMHPSSMDRLQDFRAWLNSKMEQKLNENRLSLVAYNFALQSPKEQAISLEGKRLPSIQYEKVVLQNVTENQLPGNFELVQNESHGVRRQREDEALDFVAKKKQRARGPRGKKEGNALAIEVKADKETVVGSSAISPEEDHYYNGSMITDQDDANLSEGDGLEDLWKDMSVAMECSKGSLPPNEASITQKEKEEEEEEEEEECAHSFMLEDDLGYVCRVCGVIQKRIETIFDYQWGKGNRSIRTYMPNSRNSNLGDVPETSGSNDATIIDANIAMHKRHSDQMKPHQKEGFNFLVKNLLGDPPGGCILAHAPGSGKTFMLISFIHSFMTKNLHARPLVVLPKGILATWRKEFEHWRVEEGVPLYDFYTAKADNRSQQLEVLNKWQANRSILFLGYKQFANIICEGGGSKVTEACQDKLLKVPTLLILDEGHTPRNDNTDMVDSLAKVQTPCKVVLSGTLFQNRVGEVFNILKLVRPNFMKTETSRAIVKRIMSRVIISGGRKPSKGHQESYFCELVEETLRSDEDYTRKIAVIQELRDMTRDVLHYYKGDFLDELPGLLDFTVLLNLSPKQKGVIKKLGSIDKFKKSSIEKAVHIHPDLIDIKQNASGEKDTGLDFGKINAIIDSIIVKDGITDGIKGKFFLNLLSMAESSKEKVLAFSQYLLPLKFLEMLVSRVKGWRLGKEIFVISGDSSPEDREQSMDLFNRSPDAKVLFGSIKACGEGISLVGASRVVILDVHLNPSVTRQAIGRAFRPGQTKMLYVYRLVAADSQEEDDHNTSYRKELISKMWFEWSSEHYGHRDLELTPVDIESCQDTFFENPRLGEDVKALYKR